jgi:hypothetical protein
VINTERENRQAMTNEKERRKTNERKHKEERKTDGA